MSKKQSIALCGLFVLFILVCAVLNLCWPDREFSPMENRTLAQRPDFSWKGLFSGEWSHAQARKQRHLFCRRPADCPV